MTVTIKIGDLFDQDAHLIAGFSDTFDTDTTDNMVINEMSIQGQLLRRLYNNDTAQLDTEIATALKRVPTVRENRSSKRFGKLNRYPVGTVAVLGLPKRFVFAVAYSQMGNDLVAKSSVDDLWHSLGRVWDAVYKYGQQERVAMPLVGAELARINSLDRASLLKMALLSFVARSREELLCRELVVVIHPSDYAKINMLEVNTFLKTL